MASQVELVPVILCGGSGTRLWPLSRELYPKQFVEFGSGKTLFFQTLERTMRLVSCARPVVVCNEEHRFHVTADLARAGIQAEIVLEPSPRNTAPAIALAALAASQRLLDDGKAGEGQDNCQLLLVMPSDHAITDPDAFAAGVEQAIPVAAAGHVVTFGIEPTRPETGFGYIGTGGKLAGNAHRIASFVEKPDAAKARDLLARGGYVWNSGMFLMPVALFRSELAKLAPEIASACASAWAGRVRDGWFIRPDRDAFLAAPEQSIDYAIMEHTGAGAVLPLAIGWSDLGSWEALYNDCGHDADGNVLRGDVVAEACRNSYLSSGGRLVAGLGLDGMIVVETADAVLVMPRSRTAEMRSLVKRLKAAGREECHQHRLVHRPWGSYEILASDKRFQVKRITVDPGAALSLQMHHHRAEHWVIVNGTAEVTNGDSVRLYSENQSTYIPLGTVHRLRNPGVIPLVMIEIQSGSYLGEDDIVRYGDDYGRHNNG